MIRLAHCSDIHIHTPAKWTWRDRISRRVAGWANLRFGPRGPKFTSATDVLAALVEDIYARGPDCVIFSGDATALGFEEEFALAASLLRVGQPGSLPMFAVPGNHDYYTCFSAQHGHFERFFAPGLGGERVEDATYPFARKVGDYYLIGVNSCSPTRLPWNATGRVGEEQLARFRQLLRQPEIAAAPKILVTHYPIGRQGGIPEKPWHCLLDLDAMLDAAHECGVRLWLHGHRHQAYHLPATENISLPSICAGSGTQHGVWTYAEYAIDGERLTAERRRYDPTTRRFTTSETFTLLLKR